MDVDAAKELRELRKQNTRLRRLLAEAELQNDACGRSANGKFRGPEVLGMSERLACKAFELPAPPGVASGYPA